jgi:hypothetical protein
MIGTPFSNKGSTSALYPSSRYDPAPRIDKYFVKTIFITSDPAPEWPKPDNFVLPKSLSNAAI